MKNTALRLPFLSLLLCMSVQAASSATTTNPAERYPQIFKDLDAARLDSSPEINDVDDTALDAATASFLKRHEAGVIALQDAAKLPAADWGTTEAMREWMHETLSPARRATTLLVLQSRFDLAQGRPQQAVDDLLAAISLGRNIGRQKLLVSRLVEIGIETQATDHLIAMIPSLPRDVVKTLPGKIVALPKPASGKETMLAEHAFGQSELRKQPNEPATVAAFEAARPFYVALGDAMTQTPAAFAKTVDDEAAKLPDNPFVQTVAPTFKAVYKPIAALDAKRAELVEVVRKSLDGNAG
jgi:hypothetical protein